MSTARAAGRLRISVIIPAWQDAEYLAALLPALRRTSADEVIVVDASAETRSEEAARAHGVIFMRCSAPSRGAQMNLGAGIATGDVFLFQHADAELEEAHLAALRSALRNPAVIGGAFYRQFDERHPCLRWLEPVARALTRNGGTLFGDQSVFVRREAFLRLQGFARIPLMEDVEFSRRLRASGEIVVLDPPIGSSPRHHRQKGAWRTSIQNGLFIWLYKLGVSPERLHRWYYRSLTPAAANFRAESPPTPTQSQRS